MNRKTVFWIAFSIFMIVALLVGWKVTLAQISPPGVIDGANQPELTPGQPGTTFRYVSTMGSTEPYLID